MSFMQLLIVTLLVDWLINWLILDFPSLNTVQQQQQLLQTAKKVALTSALTLWWLCDPASLLQVGLASRIDVQHSKLADLRPHSCIK